jgi:kynurenine formamidase
MEDSVNLPGRMLDLSSPLDNDTVFDPPFMRPKIEYRTNAENAPMLLDNFPGLRQEDLQEGEGWAFEVVQLSTHNGTHMDAPTHYQSKSIDGQPMMTIDQVPLDWFFRSGVKLDLRDLSDGHVVAAAEVEAELKRVGHDLRPFDIVLINTRAASCIGTDEYLTAGCGMGREALPDLARCACCWHRCLGVGCAFRTHAQTLAGNARPLHHLERPQGRA